MSLLIEELARSRVRELHREAEARRMVSARHRAAVGSGGAGAPGGGSSIGRGGEPGGRGGRGRIAAEADRERAPDEGLRPRLWWLPTKEAEA